MSGTIQRLERDLPIGVSVFDRYPFTVVSTDFIKHPRRAEDFLIKCPEFVIVDEAHGCTLTGRPGRSRQQRFELLQRIAESRERHLVLVTAIPHSGNENAFRSLLSLLDKDFLNLPIDLESSEREGARRKLAKHFVQRRRADLRHYLDKDTKFPERLDREATYTFSPEYRALFDDILEFAREYVSGEEGGKRQRVRYWSALALLRCVSSSPAAAAATLRSRASVDDVAEEEVEEMGRRTVLDMDDTDDAAVIDFNPGSVIENINEATRRRLLQFARRAESLVDKDLKVESAISEVKTFIKDGYHPIMFCRFVDTANYVAQRLRDSLPKRVRVESITGTLPPTERKNRIANLTNEEGDYVLVATDCLSEGINLQDNFNAVLHYDLAWNPTRHEQREGRVDRYGQESKDVRVITYYGTDNPIDGVILDVLIRKHKSIKSALGVTVAVPTSSEQIAEALFEAALFRSKAALGSQQMSLDFIDELGEKKEFLHTEWENARDREKASRSRFAQHTLKPEAVAEELENVRNAIGLSEDVDNFLSTTLYAANIPFERMNGGVKVHISNETPRSLRQAIGRDEPFSGRFALPLQGDEIYLGRTSPVVEGLASWVLDQALDPAGKDTATVAARCGVISTSEVESRTTLLIARFRYHLLVGGSQGRTILCEEIVPLAFSGGADAPAWLDPDCSERMLKAKPERNLTQTAIDQQLDLVLQSLPKLRDLLASIAMERSEEQLNAHERVRAAGRAAGRVSIEPVLPVDILGVYVLLPRLN